MRNKLYIASKARWRPWLVIAVLGVAVTAFLARVRISDRIENRVDIHEGSSPEIFNNNDHLIIAKLNNKSRGSSITPKDRPYITAAGYRHVGVMHAEVVPLMNFLNRREAARCRLVLERHFEEAVSYYLEALPPSSDEVALTRQKIAKILRDAPANKKEEIDSNISQLVDEYDPFGISGTRLISIRVPIDPGSPMSAWTYPVPDVAKEVRRLFSGETISAPADMQFYVGSDNVTMPRFESLILSADK